MIRFSFAYDPGSRLDFSSRNFLPGWVFVVTSPPVLCQPEAQGGSSCLKYNLKSIHAVSAC